MEPKFKRTVVIANVLAAAVSVASAVLAMVDPGIVLTGGDRVTDGVTFYAMGYGVRAVPLGVVLIALLVTRGRRAVPPMLLLAGLVQAGDSVLGFATGNLGMGFGAGAFAVVHLASAWWLRDRPAVGGVVPA
ncbi:hypothetical protein R8Z50_30535 [Longispora sp. K20-0274]|uniref:hypothetical protein n=1 Tax=Longispora sp. K20-0274 TaxID=3088255 RepID=UPI00399AE5C0